MATAITLVWSEIAPRVQWTAGPYMITKIASGVYYCTYLPPPPIHLPLRVQIAVARDLPTAKRRCRTHAERSWRQSQKL